ncbi:hypothetical protein Sme01_17640 [Sphaerisporangium melleum]|uniref:Uncharacterized protein n=1 Tax=Sphaerisporangium melleum TaxID=321316 RepID=A0A917VHL3_9ACTN|nr:hypothetical protein GCM10007964_27580 [Sphaerisporangium melleum]GII69288.1 hypothetical protein Sme01_17640 [Sphaerisporangium melleum]
MARHFRVRRILTQGAQEQGGHTQQHGYSSVAGNDRYTGYRLREGRRPALPRRPARPAYGREMAGGLRPGNRRIIAIGTGAWLAAATGLGKNAHDTRRAGTVR